MTIINSGGLNRRRFLQTTAATAMAASMPLGGALASTPKRGGHLRIGKAHGQTTDTHNPGTWENGFTIGMAFAIHGRLTEVLPDGSVGPELAESWEASPDAKTWRFNIRQGVTFHSGKPLTPEDVVASIAFHRGEDSTSAAGPIVAPIENISIDGNTVVFELSGGNADFPFILSDYHLTIHPAKGDSIDWQSADGCGSYILKDADFGVGCTMERNPNHWRDNVAWFDSIEMLALVDQNARTTALVSGDVNVVDRLDLKTVGLLARNQNINIHSVAGTQHFTFAMSTNQAPYDNNHVRQALKYAVNREEMVEKILFGYGSVGNDVPVGQGQQYYNTELEQKTFDPDKAKWHLKEAGMDSLEVSLSAADAAFAGAVDAGILFQASAKECGIDLKVVREPNDGYWSDVWMKKPFSAVYWSGRPVQDQMFSTAYTCGAAWNDSFWCNDRFEELLVAARAELDSTKREAMYFEIQDIVSNQGGVIIPMFANYVFGTSNAIGTPEKMASNWDMDGERWAERWWFA
ncbi:Periplasmic dipeptide transport protein precursor [Roseovarius litorisediminis]|uniref:Periplasmic dipeptide transport protein n=1 Tax=Roseovarius litorisediminis TaxID=1312363 RepID=A0A1Y5THX2_9RHOB|nr:ABC transporter substrate-binding protein [Roseovarius litorisediminis]SLN64680.1 Periplasmic dipeptide transport protein precursor [Roseovarius litorisediminis]